jgi:acetyl esterase/lipase
VLGIPAHAEARRPFVLVFHGGAWTGGSPRDMDPLVRHLREHGVAAKAARYPLGQGGDPAFASARRQVRRYRRRWAVYATGGSAGATMALWLAARREVRGAVSLAGPTDLEHWCDPGSKEEWAVKYFAPEKPPCSVSRDTFLGPVPVRRRLSPLGNLSRRSAPTVLLHARDDPFVPYDSQGARFVGRSRRMKVRSRLDTYPSGGHALTAWAQAAAARRVERLVRTTEASRRRRARR